MSTLQDLLAQREALDRQIEETRRNARKDAVAKVMTLVNEFGLQVDRPALKPAAKWPPSIVTPPPAKPGPAAAAPRPGSMARIALNS